MGSTLYLGRVAAPVSTAKFWGPQGWDASGDNVSIRGAIACDSPTEATVIRNQLLGLANNVDETFIPVRWTADPSIDGYYRVTGVSVPMHGSSLAHGRFDFTVNLTRVGSYGSPHLETIYLNALRTNAVSVTAFAFDIALPTAADAVLGYIPTANMYPVSAATGNVDVSSLTGLDDPFGYALEYHVPPADWYDGAATLYLSTTPADQAGPGDIDTFPVVTGRQIPNNPGGWVLSNGIIQLWTDLATSELRMQGWDGTRWRASGVNDTGTKRFIVVPQAGSPAATSIPTWRTMRVLRNSPAEVVIRLTGDYDPAGAEPAGWLLDLSLKRGQPFVSAVLSQYVSTGDAVQWAVATTEASTAMGSAGIRATASDGSGDRYVILTPQAIVTFDHTNGKIVVDAPLIPAVYPAMFGLAISNPATGPLSTSGIRDAYFNAGGERLAVS